jgi:hypothetical protein
MNIYTQHFWATCPENGRSVDYTLVIESPAMIMVEEIQKAAAEMKGYHEQIANELMLRFKDTQQTLEAHHHGTHIKTIRP